MCNHPLKYFKKLITFNQVFLKMSLIRIDHFGHLGQLLLIFEKN